MARFLRRQLKGQLRGIARPNGDVEQAVKARIRVIDFTVERLDERELDEIGLVASYRWSDSVTWINLDGLGDVDAVRRLGELFNLCRC